MSSYVPDGWVDTSIAQLTADNSLFKDGDWVESKDQDPFGNNRLIQLADIGDGRFINKSSRFLNDEQFSRLNCTELEKGDILVARMPEPLGRACIYPLKSIRAATIVDVAVIRTKNADHYWLMSAINSSMFRHHIDLNASGTTRTRIARGALAKLRLIAPPLPEQLKIAQILTSVDEVIEKTQAQIDKLKDLKTAMMQELLTKGIGHVEFKDSPVGTIPVGWDCVQLETLLANTKYPMRSGPFGSALLKHELVLSGHPYLGIDNVHIERFDKSYKRYVDDKKFDQLKRYSVFEDDVMITIMGTVGRSCVVPKGVGKALSSKHVWTMTFDDQKCLSNLICWQLNYSTWVRNQFKNESQGGVMESISSKTLKQLWLPLPPIIEQRKISKAHDVISKLIESKCKKLKSTKSIKKALMQDLLTGKVRVNTEQSNPALAVG
jgi:type I restriction enzyme S subunit